jgi:hypothetical protein
LIIWNYSRKIDTVYSVYIINDKMEMT